MARLGGPLDPASITTESRGKLVWTDGDLRASKGDGRYVDVEITDRAETRAPA